VFVQTWVTHTFLTTYSIYISYDYLTVEAPLIGTDVCWWLCYGRYLDESYSFKSIGGVFLKLLLFLSSSILDLKKSIVFELSSFFGISTSLYFMLDLVSAPRGLVVYLINEILKSLYKLPISFSVISKRIYCRFHIPHGISSVTFWFVWPIVRH